MQVNREVKGLLAKCLASENLIVEYRNVSTASFNVESRVLILPNWKKASDSVFTMLTQHEAAHAIFSKYEDYSEEYPNVPHDVVNVLEDVRVERLMKKRYAGSAKHFYAGYQELNDQDFFSTKGQNLNSFSFIDRINLYFKIGAFHNIQFNDDENEFVTRISRIETFDEVLRVAQDLVDYIQEKKQEQMQIPNPSQMSNEEQSSSSSSTEQNNSNENSEEGEDSQNNQSNPNSDDKSDAQKQSTDLNRSVSQTESDSDNSDNQNSDENGNEASNKHSDELESKTAQSFSEKSKTLNDKFAREVAYVELPDVYLDKIIIPNAWIHKKTTDYHTRRVTQGCGYEEELLKVDKQYLTFKKSAEKEVSYLVKEFECKKSADQYARASTARTGILDTTKLHTYKFNEDLFKKISVVPDGKNHGLIFILDWSGSMQNWIMDTCKQLFNLIWFCRKINIPFEVYAFTLDGNSYIELQPNHPATYNKVKDVIGLEYSFRLMNFFTSKVNSRTLEEQMKNIWRAAFSLQKRGWSVGYPAHMSLSGSPIGESILCLHKIIPQFQRENKLQKVNVIFLTDGEGYVNAVTQERKNKYDGTVDIGMRKHEQVVIRDRKTGRVYPSFDYYNFSNYSKILLQTVKDHYSDVNLINFRVSTSSDFYSCWSWYGSTSFPTYDEAKKLYSKQNYITFKNTGYDQFNVIPTNTLSQEETFEVNEDASPKQIKTAFSKLLNKKKTNRKLLSSFVELIA